MNDSFRKILLANFNTFCQHRGIESSDVSFLDFLLAYNIIKRIEVCHYVVLFEFASLAQSGKYNTKTQAIKALAVRYNLEENAIWNILKDHKDKFQLKL